MATHIFFGNATNFMRNSLQKTFGLKIPRFRACQRSREGVVQRIRRPKVDCGLSILFSALESKVGDSKVKCHLDQ